MGEPVLPVILMPEEAALILDEGLASLSIMLSVPAAQRPPVGTSGGLPTGGKISIPHVPPHAHGDAERGAGGLEMVGLRRKSDGTLGWGLPTKELLALWPEQCGSGAASEQGHGTLGIGAGKRMRDDDVHHGTAADTKDSPGAGAGETDTYGDGSEGAADWRVLWEFPATKVWFFQRLSA